MNTHRLGRRLASVLLAAAVAVPLAAVASGGSAFGVTYTVPCNGGDTTALILAINNANATPGTADTINLAANCTYLFTGPNNSGSDGPNALPVITSPITINGNGSTLQRTGGPDYRIVEVSTSGKLTTSYLTLTGGLLEQSGPSVGAGILNYGSATLKYTKVLDNHVEITDLPMFGVPIGGGIANQGGILSVSNSDVSNNTAEVPPELCSGTPCNFGSDLGIPLGGGIGNTGTTTISSSTITHNTADAFSFYVFAFGGGIASGLGSAPAVTISSSKLTDNTVGGYAEFGLAVGGGFAGNALNMSSTEVARNTASAYTYQGGVFGGGLSVLQASNISSSSSIHDNSATGFGADAAGGGIDIAHGAALTINSSAIFANTVSSNSNVSNGGGIRNAGTLTLNTTRVSGNSALASNGGVTAEGGGIYNESGGSVKLNSSSVKSNTAGTTGGGVYNADSSPTAVSGSVTSITTNTPNNCVNVSGCVG